MAAWLAVGAAGCLATDERPASQGSSWAALGQSLGDSGACGSITYQGCCDGETLYYCESGHVLPVDCSLDLYCGWDSAASYYNCGTGGQPDPGGAYSKSCDFGDTGPPNVNPCGNVTSEGCCDGETLYWCDSNGVNTVSCATVPFCGWSASASYYACLTNGQADPSGVHSKACSFDAAVPVPDLGPPVPCGNVTWVGCCDGETVKRCVSGELVVTDCASVPYCGWNGLSYGCEMSGKADPSGVNPKSCATLLDASAPDGAVPCGDVTWQGCCDGETLYYCHANGLQVLDCRRAPSCGWSGGNYYYDCLSEGAEDPKGLHPKACNLGDAGPPVVDNHCGAVTWQGCCDGSTAYYCEGGIVKSKDCGQNPLCGWRTSGTYSFYDCNTDGKADPSGQLPKACPFDGGVPDAASDASPACGPVTHHGCCEGETLYWCEAGTLNSMDCSKSPSCGWQPGAEYYDCNTDGIADPFGEHPMACGFDGGAPILDQGQRLDARPSQDKSIHDTAAGSPPTDSGCGCALVPQSPGGVTLLLLLALVVTLRRRPA